MKYELVIAHLLFVWVAVWVWVLGQQARAVGLPWEVPEPAAVLEVEPIHHPITIYIETSCPPSSGSILVDIIHPTQPTHVIPFIMSASQILKRKEGDHLSSENLYQKYLLYLG